MRLLILLFPSTPPLKSRTGRDKKEATRFSFTFDKVFSPLAKQSVVFEEISHLVQVSVEDISVLTFPCLFVQYAEQSIVVYEHCQA